MGSPLYLSHVPLDCKRSTGNLLRSVKHVRTRAFGADLLCLLVIESSQVTRMTAKGTPPQSACSQACSNTTLAFGTRSQWRDSTYLLELLFACTGFCLQAHSFCLHTVVHEGIYLLSSEALLPVVCCLAALGSVRPTQARSRLMCARVPHGSVCSAGIPSVMLRSECHLL